MPIGNIKALWELVEKATAMAQEAASEKTLNAVLIAMKQNGGCADADELEQAGFTKLQIIKAAEMASMYGYVTDASTKDGLGWCLSLKGDYYTTALLESREGR